MSDTPIPKKDPSRPPKPVLAEPPRTKSGEVPAVQGYRAKLESIADGAFDRVVSLNEQLASFVDELRGVTTPPPAAPPPSLRPVEEVPPASDDIIGWDDVHDAPIRRSDLRASVLVDADEHNRWSREADTRKKVHTALVPPDEADTEPEGVPNPTSIPPPPARVRAGTGRAVVVPRPDKPHK